MSQTAYGQVDNYTKVDTAKIDTTVTYTKGQKVEWQGKTYVCKDATACGTTDIGSDKTIWKPKAKKPAIKAATQEYKDKLTNATMDGCYDFIPSEVYMEGTPICGEDGKVYKCNDPNLCGYFPPVVSDGSGGFVVPDELSTIATALGITGGIFEPYLLNNTGTQVEIDSTFTEFDDTITETDVCPEWIDDITQRLTFYTGDCVIDASNVWICDAEQFEMCKEIRPSTQKKAFAQPWFNTADVTEFQDLAPPPSTVKEQLEWQYQGAYLLDDIAIFQDKAYICIWEGECGFINPLEGLEYQIWLELDTSPLPPDFDCAPWTENYAYQFEQYVCDLTTQTVYQCQDRQFVEYCRYDPTSEDGAKGWTPIPLYAVPPEADTYSPPIFVVPHDFTRKMPFFEGDMIGSLDAFGNLSGPYLTCVQSPLCREAATLTQAEASNSGWEMYNPSNTDVFEAVPPEIIGDIITQQCLEWSGNIQYNTLALTCDAAGNVYECLVDGDTCTATDPTSANAFDTWHLNRMLGSVVASNADLVVSDYYQFDGYAQHPYLPGDKILFGNAIYECTEGLKSIGCAYFWPGDFAEDAAGNLIPNPWELTDELPGVELALPVKPQPESCIPWRFSKEFNDVQEIWGTWEWKFDPVTLTDYEVYKPFKGWITFVEGDNVCLDGRVLKCIALECDLDPRDPNQVFGTATSMWMLTQSPAKQEEPPTPEFIRCGYPIYNFESEFYKPGKHYCLDNANGQIEVFRCREQPFAHLCNVYEPMSRANIPIEDFETAWEKITVDASLNQFLDLYDAPWNTTPKIRDAMKPQLECIDWYEVNGFDSTTLFKFPYKKLACDADRVWECEDEALCNEIPPAEAEAVVWRLTGGVPVPIPAPKITQFECFDWQEGYAYFSGDFVCTDGQVWKCEYDFECPFTRPSINVSFQNMWTLVKDIEGVIVDKPQMETVTCKDYTKYMSNDPVPPTTQQYVFAKDDIICDLGLAYVCVVEEHCADVRPSLSLATGRFAWERIRAVASLQSTPERTWPKPEYPRCMDDDYVIDGPWTGQDRQETAAPIYIENGRVCSDDTEIRRKMFTSYVIGREMPNNLLEQDELPRNLDIVLHSISEEEVEYMFPKRYMMFDLFSFVEVTANFPAFCGDHSTRYDSTQIAACRRELAMFLVFAGMGTMTDALEPEVPAWRTGLMSFEDEACADYVYNGGADPGYDCYEWAATTNDVTAMYPEFNLAYFARGAGPIPLVGATDYGRFSEDITGNRLQFLEEPDEISSNPSLAIGVAMWRWMGVHSGAPTLHDMVTGFWEPNVFEENLGFKTGAHNTFLAAIMSIAGSTTSCKYEERIIFSGEIWKVVREFADIDFDPNEDVICSDVDNVWPEQFGTNSGYMYFQPPTDTTVQGQCELTNIKTPYHLYSKGSYKRCVADLVNPTFAEAAASLEWQGYECSPWMQGFPYRSALVRDSTTGPEFAYDIADRVCEIQQETSATGGIIDVYKVFECKNWMECSYISPFDDLNANGEFWEDISSGQFDSPDELRIVPPYHHELLCYPVEFFQNTDVTTLEEIRSQEYYDTYLPICIGDRVWMCEAINPKDCADASPMTEAQDFLAGTINSVTLMITDAYPDPWVPFDQRQDYMCFFDDYVNTDATVDSSVKREFNHPEFPELFLIEGNLCTTEPAAFEVVNQSVADVTLSTGANTELIQTFFTADHFAELFPIANSAYTYDTFLAAVAKFPNFCQNYGWYGSNISLSMEESCKKQIAGLLTLVMLATNKGEKPTSATDTTTPPLHTQGLFKTKDDCYANNDCYVRQPAADDYGTYFSVATLAGETPMPMEEWHWPLDEGLFLKEVWNTNAQTNSYEGRGAGWLNEWELYLRFDDVVNPIEPAVLFPQIVSVPEYIWETAIFRFVTPVGNRPSPQQLIIGNWQPNNHELDQGIWFGLGAAIKLYWGEDLCGERTREGEEARLFYEIALETFGFDIQLLGDDVNTCTNMFPGEYPRGGRMGFPQYFDTALPTPIYNDKVALYNGVYDPQILDRTPIQASAGSCIPVRYPTRWSMFTPGDYKRCVEANNAYCAAEAGTPGACPP